MGKGLYFKLAKENLRRNRRMYFPYAVAVAVMSGVFFIILNTVLCESISNMSFGNTMRVMLLFGLVVMALFTYGYMLYLNSFLIKNRRREFGLYGILGLEKRHVGRIILLENTMLNLGSLALGLLCGTVFGKLAFMVLLALTNVAPDSRFELSLPAYLITVLGFGAIFLTATIYNQFQVRLANPIDLINGEKKGEKKLRGVPLMTVVGLICLGGAYYFAIATKDKAIAIGMFWPAVILVIIATNLLFLAGSQFVLRAIRRTPRLYYRPNTFISVSGLMHRLKQNAAGLSNICILSTMVLVTISGVCALYFGQEEMIKGFFRNDLEIAVYYDAGEVQSRQLDDTLNELRLMASERGYAIDSLYAYHSKQETALLSDGQLAFKDQNGNYNLTDSEASIQTVSVLIMPLEDYSCISGQNRVLQKDELLVIAEPSVQESKTVQAGGKSFQVQEWIREFPLLQPKEETIKQVFLVAGDMEKCRELGQAVNPSSGDSNWAVEFCMNFTGGDYVERAEFSRNVADHLGKRMAEQLSVTLVHSSGIDEYRAESYGVYGGLLFLGIFFSLLFITNTVLIMYFKQVSEGYEDRARYEIMRKVGMSNQEVRNTINRQVLIVFFLPLAGALMHILAATNMITQILNAFVMTNNALTLACIAVTSAVYILIYLLVFRITARTYYKIVR